jgi:hypothetical protein
MKIWESFDMPVKAFPFNSAANRAAPSPCSHSHAAQEAEKEPRVIKGRARIGHGNARRSHCQRYVIANHGVLWR